MKSFLITFAFLLPLGIYAQGGKYDAQKELRGSGRVVQETKLIGAFDGIEINQFPAKVTVESGAAESSVAISVDHNLQSMLRIVNEDSTLKFSFSDSQNKPFWISKSTINITVRTPSLKRLKNRWSNSDIVVKGLSGDSFALVNEANANITLRGKVDTFDLVSSANGTIDADELIAKTANIVTRANATVRINAQLVNEVKLGRASLVNVSNRPK